jgi:hypothetical protein
MRSDRGDAWDSNSGDPFDSVDRGDWDEADWEAFLFREDALNAKYQELYETLRDHPNRDELIAREMRWNLPEDLFGGPPDAFDQPPEDCPEDEAPEGDEGHGEAFAADLEAIPAFGMARSYALAVERQVTARLRDGVAADADASHAVRAAVDVSERIASGHGIGYERESLCGNIACCKRALVSLAECLDSLLTLRSRGVLAPGEANELLSSGQRLAETVAQRVEELRGCVWWR